MRWNPKEAVAIVTGASSGIGNCMTRQLLDQGSHVVGVARRGAELENLADQYLGKKAAGRLFPVVGDLTDPDTRDQIFQVASSLRNGEVDLLVNNAGVGAIGPFVDATPQRLRQVMEINFFAPVELTRRMIPALRLGRAPVVCNISSVLGHCGVPRKSEYCASKFALHGWSDALRNELVATGIQVTLVSPSTTRSEFFDALIETGDGQTSSSIGSWPPEKVASRAIAAIKNRRREVILSLGGKLLVYADRFAPSLLDAILARDSRRGVGERGHG